MLRYKKGATLLLPRKTDINITVRPENHTIQRNSIVFEQNAAMLGERTFYLR